MALDAKTEATIRSCVAKARKLDPMVLRLGSEWVRGDVALQARRGLCGPAVWGHTPAGLLLPCSGTRAVLLPSYSYRFGARQSAGEVSVMTTLLVILLIWFLVSIFVAMLIGPILRRLESTEVRPEDQEEPWDT